MNVRLENAQRQREEWAVRLADQDRALLALRDDEGLTLRQLGARLGISPEGVSERLKAARRREETRQAMAAAR